ncbi:MAG: sulfotransferase [Hyphomicrobiales bacterium]|nr:sulfotransferase [Hyphomicrobiales bacterium]MBV8825445.1 sulfotransferase [Hyphomicrobiales bacterium]MBV9430092.1 sulfotransferase [Bradyrhizobiaceae bacterium]
MKVGKSSDEGVSERGRHPGRKGRPDSAARLRKEAARHREAGRLEEAIDLYRRAVALAPNDARAHGGLATALRDLRRFAEADACYRQALALDPLDTWTLNNAAQSARWQRRLDEALALVTQSAIINPRNHETFTLLAAVEVARREFARATAACARALELHPGQAEALNILGRIAYEEGRNDEAITHYREALARDPKLAAAHNNLGSVLRERGEIEAARSAFRTAIELEPRLAIAFLNFADLHRFAPGDAVLAAMEELAGNPAALTESEQIWLAFALGKAYADLGDHAHSFQHLLLGNNLKRQQIFYDESATLAHFERIRAVFTKERMAERSRGEGSPTPVLIVGMPRSGTTLVEQILASHPKVFGAGELPDLPTLTANLRDGGGADYPDCIAAIDRAELRACGEAYVDGLRRRAPDAACITDKLPANFANLGLACLAVPNVRIVHVRRDPLDTCLSCFSKLFAQDQLHFAYDLAELGRYYRAYARLMEHWRTVLPPGRMLELQYEEVVADPKPHARRLLAHCGLEWDAACLRFHETRRPVRTLSAVQVREPLFRRSIGRARPYKEWLGPLLEAGVAAEPTA